MRLQRALLPLMRGVKAMVLLIRGRFIDVDDGLRDGANLIEVLTDFFFLVSSPQGTQYNTPLPPKPRAAIVALQRSTPSTGKAASAMWSAGRHFNSFAFWPASSSARADLELCPRLS